MLRLFCFLLLFSTAAPPSMADEDGAVAAVNVEEVQRLVTELRDSSYSRRQAATKSLLALPESSRVVLSDLRAAAPRETSERLNEILDCLYERWFQQRLQRLSALPADSSRGEVADLPDALRLEQHLAADTAGTPDAPGSLPSDLLDTGIESTEPRSVLLHLLRAESEVFAASIYQPGRLPELLEHRSAKLALNCNGRADQPFPTASALALMLVASRAELRLLRKTSSNVSRPLEDPRFDQLLQSGRNRGVLRSIVSEWIRRPGISADRPLIFAIRHRLSAGRDVAVRVLQSEGRGPQVYFACMCLAALGSSQDIALLESRLQSTQVIWPPRGAVANDGAVDSRLQVQTRDAALAALVHLRQIPPASVGLKLTPSRDELYRIDTVGAISDEIREARIGEYRAKTANP
ncbi:MAG: hypothetical protein ACKO2L_00985 [Planctomycetaceae bacterium]